MAGDIFSAASLRPHRCDANSRKNRERSRKFCRTQLSKYQRVLMVGGNHEPYGEIIEDSADLIRELLANYAPNAQLLDNERADIGGVAIMGTTLWAQCGHGRADEWQIANAMRCGISLGSEPERRRRISMRCSKSRAVACFNRMMRPG